MRRDAELLLSDGADGIVFGLLHSDATLNAKRCEKMLEIASGKQAVFHRAFDVVPDPIQGLDLCLGSLRALGRKPAYLRPADASAVPAFA